MNTNCPKVSYQASAAFDPKSSVISSDTSLGKASSEGRNSKWTLGVSVLDCFCSESALKAVCDVKCSTEVISRSFL